jgi:hypothetical protein
VLHYHRPYPAEYQLRQDPPAAIAKLPSMESNTLVDNIAPQKTRRSVSHHFYFAALACLVGSFLLRRV